MIALLFPGQGAQCAGMLHALAALDGGADLVARAGDRLGRDLLASDTAAGYASTATAQCALFVAGVASTRALAAAGVGIDAVAGHSVGAFAAAVACDALSFERGLEAVACRGAAMEAAFPDGYGMGAIGGIDERRVAAIVREIAAGAATLYVANVNAADRVTIAGTLAAVDAALDAARGAGARSAQRLDVAVPSHSPLMRRITPTLEAALTPADVRAPRIPYAANVTGRLLRDAARLRADLVTNAEHPVRWADMTQVLYETGVRVFIEARPGSVLTNLARSAFADVVAVALESTNPATLREFASRA